MKKEEGEAMVREISLADIEGLRIGHAQDEEAMTGVTVLLFDRGARVGVDISGGGPASRETPLALPLTADNPVDAIVLSGGSAFGLAASDGVMRYLEERGIGYDTGFAKVPLVCQSCIYDLGCGRADVRPDSAMGYGACVDAERSGAGQAEVGRAASGLGAAGAGASGQPGPGMVVSGPDVPGQAGSDAVRPDGPGQEAPVQTPDRMGCIGAGTGATVGKLYGMERSMKGGLGICAVAVGKLKMAAIVVVNAVGDIVDPKTGKKVAGLRSEDGKGFGDTRTELYKISQRRDLFNSNTTIGVVVTNGRFSKAEMAKIASMARNAYARCIDPVGTMADGDTIYAASIGGEEADLNMAGTLAAQVMTEAILRAVR